jgi:hypothetical protein
VYVGPIRASRNLESMCELWVTASYFTKDTQLSGGNWAFGVTFK